MFNMIFFFFNIIEFLKDLPPLFYTKKFRAHYYKRKTLFILLSPYFGSSELRFRRLNQNLSSNGPGIQQNSGKE